MYAWLFSLLPGPTWVKWIQALLILALVVYALMEVVYPWMSEFGIFTDSTMEIEG